MTNQNAQPLIDVETLRREFDNSFSSPAKPSDAALDQFLAIKVAGQRVALRVSELSRVEARRAIAPLPVENPHLLGLAGLQGRITPIYSLASILGFPREEIERTWIAVTAGAEPIGLAFERFEAHFSVPRAQILDLKLENSARQYVRSAVRFENEVRNIVQLQSLVEAIRSAALAGKEFAKESST